MRLAFHDVINVLVRGSVPLLPPPPHTNHVRKPGRELPPEPDCADDAFSEFSASRTVGHKLLLLKPPRVWYLLQQPQLRGWVWIQGPQLALKSNKYLPQTLVKALGMGMEWEK